MKPVGDCADRAVTDAPRAWRARETNRLTFSGFKRIRDKTTLLTIPLRST